MSVINFTLVIQALNFLIAFFIIKYFFFKNAVYHIHAEDTLQESLVSAVQEHQMAVGSKEQEIGSHWQAMRAYFAKNIPSLKVSPLFALKKPSIVIPEFEQSAIKDAAHSLAAQLIKKVDHVE